MNKVIILTAVGVVACTAMLTQVKANYAALDHYQEMAPILQRPAPVEITKEQRDAIIANYGVKSPKEANKATQSDTEKANNGFTLE